MLLSLSVDGCPRDTRQGVKNIAHEGELKPGLSLFKF